MKDENSAESTRVPRIRFTRHTAVWLVGAAVLVTATAAAGFASNGGPSASPTPTADKSTRDALDAIVAQHPGIGRPISTLVKQGKLPKPTYAGDTGTIGVPKNATQPTSTGQVVRYVPGSVKGDFNLLQLSALALWVGCSPAEAPIAAAIAAAESGGNPGAQGDITLMDGTWDWSQGLWQIRGLRAERGTGGLRDSLANADPQKNAHAMYTISSGCTNWTPWSTYTSGAYLAYLGMSKTAVLAAKQFENQTGTLPTFGTGAPATVPSPTSSSTRSTHPSAPKHHKHKSGHKSGSGGKHHHGGTPKPGASSKAAGGGGGRSSTNAPVTPPSTSAVPHPVSSVISKITSAVPSILPKPSKTPKLPVPSAISSVVGGVTSAIPSIFP